MEIRIKESKNSGEEKEVCRRRIAWEVEKMQDFVNPKQIPRRTLYTGKEIPALGIGTFGSDKYSAREIAEAVYGAVCCGYRMIDCASVYQNEKEIGIALRQLFQEKVVKREELFITGKVWNDMHGEGEVCLLYTSRCV